VFLLTRRIALAMYLKLPRAAGSGGLEEIDDEMEPRRDMEWLSSPLPTSLESYESI